MTMQTFTPEQYLMIDVANNFGLDKELWEDRISWFQDNEYNLAELIPQADSPALFVAGIKAYSDHIQGMPISYPISLDATASGAQLLAVMMGCEVSASQCNVVDTGRREDLYTNVYSKMQDLEDIADAQIEAAGMELQGAKLERDEVKEAVMTSLYGSKAVPKKYFGEGEQLMRFYESVTTMLPGAWWLNEKLLSLWNPEALEHSWILPDNFHVIVKNMVLVTESVMFLDKPYEVTTQENQASDTGLSIAANATHSVDGLVVREMGRRCDYNSATVAMLMEQCLTAPKHIDVEFKPILEDDIQLDNLLGHYRISGFLSARVMEFTNPRNFYIFSMEEREALWNLLESLPKKPFSILTTHDCFRAHPNYGNDLRRQYNRILSEIADSDLISDIASQITGRDVVIPKLGNIGAKILESNYALS